MRKPGHSASEFKKRRETIAGQIKGSALVIASHPELIRNNDVHYPYRQDSSLFYLTGFEESECVFVLRPGCNPEYVMFVQPKDKNLETWTGFRYGVDGVKTYFGADAAFPIDKMGDELPKLLKEVDKVYYSMFINRAFDAKLMKLIEKIAHERSRTNKGNLTIEDSRILIGEMRIKKSDYEIEQLRKACLATSEAHVEVMKNTRPHTNERNLHGVFLRAIMERGCAREGYGSIVATGNNATTLHYVYNDQPLREGDMLLVDAGGEFNFYTSDITRTYPVSGKFNPAQKRVYQKVLDLQKRLVEMVAPGQTRDQLQKEAISGLTDIFIDEKLLRGKREALIEAKEYMKFYPHGVGHWLGMDVHDTGLTEVSGEPRRFEAGFVLTIEPGVYVPQDTPDVPKELLGLGIRIEDDILVTATGRENLTIRCPKEIDELEALIGKA